MNNFNLAAIEKASPGFGFRHIDLSLDFSTLGFRFPLPSRRIFGNESCCACDADRDDGSEESGVGEYLSEYAWPNKEIKFF
jgi:hypothetical protein